MTIYRDDLERVYALIEKPEAWQKKSYTNAVWKEDGSLEKRPTCFCLAGAYLEVVEPENDGYVLKMSHYLDDLAGAMGFDYGDTPALFDFNDTHTHAEVLALLKSAIERAPVRP